MSIASEITRINNNISAAYTACNNKGATMPQTQNSANLATTIGTISTGGSSRDWTQIGYSDEPDFIDDGFIYAKQIYDNWTPTTSYFNKFGYDKNLIFMPLVNMSSGTNFWSAFQDCVHLLKVPALNCSSGTTFSSMFENCVSLTEVGQLNTSSGITFNYMFSRCRALQVIPLIDCSNGTSFEGMFQDCEVLTSVPNLDTSNGKNFDYMFQDCKSLTTAPNLDTSNGEHFDNMFYGCAHLSNLPSINVSSGKTFGTMFYECYDLITLPLLDCSSAQNVSGMFSLCSNLTNVGGLKDLGEGFSTSNSANYSLYTIDFTFCYDLTEQSLINILTNLYDIATKGCNVQKCTLGATNIAKLTSSAGQAALIQAQNYGWTIS